jgi:hypothetical protein
VTPRAAASSFALILARASIRQMQALGWRYMLFPGLFGALVLMAFAAATDELARLACRLALPRSRCGLR